MQPIRWMISTKRVGRSPAGRVNTYARPREKIEIESPRPVAREHTCTDVHGLAASPQISMNVPMLRGLTWSSTPWSSRSASSPSSSTCQIRKVAPPTRHHCRDLAEMSARER